MQTSSRKILIVEFFSRGGLIHYSLQLARALATEAAPGVEVVLQTARHPEASTAPAGVRIQTTLDTWNPHRPPRYFPRKLVRVLRGLRYLWVWCQVLAAARRERPSLVLLTDLEHRCDAWFVRRLHAWCRRQQPQVALADIWHNVEPFERCRSGPLQRHLRWRIPMARDFDTVFVHGHTLQAHFTALTDRGACVIPHGNQVWFAEQAGPNPNLRHRFRLPPEKPLALLFGSLNPYKGVDVALEAMAALSPGARPMLLIAGMPTAASQLDPWQRFVRQQRLEPWVRWDTRYVPSPEIAWYFRLADWVVLPYRVASQSGVGHLALTFGKPLLVTATGGLPELIDGNGLVVPPGSPAALAEAMAQFASQPESRRQWARRSAQLASTRHAWEPIARTVLQAAAPGLLVPAPPFSFRPDARSAPLRSRSNTSSASGRPVE